MRDLRLKYYYLSREKLEPIGAHNFTADGIISATLYNVSNNTAKQIYCIKMILSFHSLTAVKLHLSQVFQEKCKKKKKKAHQN